MSAAWTPFKQPLSAYLQVTFAIGFFEQPEMKLMTPPKGKVGLVAKETSRIGRTHPKKTIHGPDLATKVSNWVMIF